MNVSFGSGLIKLNGTYYNPDKISKIENTEYGKTDIYVDGKKYTEYYVKPDNVADAFVKAQKSGEVVECQYNQI